MKYFSCLTQVVVLLVLGLLSNNTWAWSYATATKNARLDAITTMIDAGASAGKLEIGPTGMGSVCVTFTLNDPSAAAASGGVWTLAGTPKTANASGACTAGAARIRDSNNNDIITGLTVTATGGGGNITVDNTSIANGQSVQLNGFTLTSGN